MSAPLATRIAEEHAAASESLPRGLAGAERRRKATGAWPAQGLPPCGDENWKYANRGRRGRVRSGPAAAPPQGSVTLANLPPPLEGYARYVFVDGRFTPALSTPAERAGVRVDSLSRSPSVVLLPSVPAVHVLADARFALLNEAFATDGAAIRIASGTDCPACLELVFVASADAQAGT